MSPHPLPPTFPPTIPEGMMTSTSDSSVPAIVHSAKTHGTLNWARHFPPTDELGVKSKVWPGPFSQKQAACLVGVTDRQPRHL